ncbi:protein n-terminal glutamine amidohydrolase [Moniliophthora roreri]|nr:protein n-terminal glutamine amidohydrolase [Moniliophthora roreri]
MTLSPPLTPTDRQYTLFWCEENVYLLAQNFLRDAQIVSNWDLFAVFISNAAQTVALWNQKLAQEPGLPVVWDYHVILVLRLRLKNPGDQPVAWVYDFDTILSFPTSWTGIFNFYYYFGKTFSAHVLPNFQSSFRVIPANEYIDHFASDRSHMVHSFSSRTLNDYYTMRNS